MGVDKATLVVEGVAMARRVGDALELAGCSPVIAVGGEATELRGLGLEHVADEFPGEGPLGGILTALSHGAPAVVLACDLPNITAPTITTLIDSVGDHDAAIAYSDRAEPLVRGVVGERSSVAARSFRRWRTGTASGHRRPRHRLGRGARPAELRNVNTPADLRSL